MSLFGQNTGFGGFGTSNNTSGGFGQSSNAGTGFGAGNTGTPGFGGFGSGSTGFGSNNTTANNNSLFGQNKPAFGASTSGGGLFGSGTATSGTGFGGFGSSNTNNTSGGGLFSQAPKPAFGGGSSGGGLFSNTNTNANTGFGSSSNQTTSGFGSPFGGNNAVCEGTGSTPFSAFTEKEGASSITNHFQSVSFMAPYKNWSFEELRLADYNQGRRYGNGSGQAGAFGSTNFGGFGQQQQSSSGFGQQPNTNTGGLFGSNNSSSTPFGSSQPSGFGNTSTGSGLFGQKSGGLFGAATSSGTSGGLFSTSNNNNTGFGSGTTGGGFGTANPNGGSLFGQNSNQQQSKPFSFGSTTSTAVGGFSSGNTGFGNTNTNTNTGGGLFGTGNQNNSNPFGQSNNSQSTNPFGGFGQQAQNQNQNSGSNLFGGFGQQNQDQKPGGLFGNTSNNTSNTVGGLFGNQNNNQSSGGLFGQPNNNQSSGGSLFDQKPATGGGLFGANNANTSNASGGLFSEGFGNQNQNQNQQNQGGGLFGNANNQQKPGGLFGTTNSGSGGGALFGNNSSTNNQQSGGSLFNLGGQNQQQQQQPAGGGLFGNSTNSTTGSSLFGNSQQQQQPTPLNQFQPAQTLQTSIMDPNAFGSPSIFSGLPPPPQVSGPIATPISQKNRQKKGALLPYYKMAPSHASAFQTPTRRGYGFTYSTYGSPNSVSSVGSPPGGLGGSSFYSSIGRPLGKSLSTSNLRRNFGNAESVLSPGAFSTGSSRQGSAGSMKKLTIDRSLRTDLFGARGTPAALPSPEKDSQPGTLKKKVSFDANTIGGNGEQQNGVQANVTNGDSVGSTSTPSAEEQGLLRSPRNQPKAKANGGLTQSEMEPVRGNELAIVPEDGPPEAPGAPLRQTALPRSQEDQKVGAYWMKPPQEKLQRLSKEELREVRNFSVGRDGCGRVEFNKPVDLSNINLNDIYETLVMIGIRSLTVYPDISKKPSQGKGLNVPSTIYLENSWPRQRDHKTPLHEKSGAKFNRHVERLRKVGDTEFVDYKRDTGTWIFNVPHFTTYSFEYDDDASEGESLHLSKSVLTEAPDTPTPLTRASSMKTKPGKTNAASAEAHQPVQEPSSGQKSLLPGSFDESILPETENHEEMLEISSDDSPADGPHASSSESSEDEILEMGDIEEGDGGQTLVVREADQEVEMDMAGAFPENDEELTKQAIELPLLSYSGDWTVDLLTNLRPRKRNRQTLRQEQAKTSSDDDLEETPSQANTKRSKGAMLTSIDLMNSLFGQSEGSKGKSQRKVSRRASVQV